MPVPPLALLVSALLVKLGVSEEPAGRPWACLQTSYLEKGRSLTMSWMNGQVKPSKEPVGNMPVNAEITDSCGHLTASRGYKGVNLPNP